MSLSMAAASAGLAAFSFSSSAIFLSMADKKLAILV